MAYANETVQHGAVAEINITPLVDVMLVLLVIFMIAAPILTQRIRLDLPVATPPTEKTEPPPPILLRIDAAGQVYWNGSATPRSALPAMLDAERARDGDNPATLQIDASDEADYGAIAQVLAAANNAEWTRVGFVRH